jgi:hypothetical protein
VVCYINKMTKNGSPVSYWKNENAFTPQEAANLTDRAVMQRKDVFFAIGQYKGNLSQVEKDGRFYPKVGRKKEHCKSLRLLIADIDCGEGKPYQSVEDGVVACKTAMAKLGFLASEYTMNCSGGGVHMYLRLEHSLPSSDWVRLATRYKSALLSTGLDIDISKTTDEALVLRPVGTFNFKKIQPRKVEMLQMATQDITFSRLDTILQPYENRPELTQYPSHPVDDSFISQFPTDLPATSLSLPESIAKISPKWQAIKCPQLLALEQDANVDEPLWYQALGVAAHTSEPREAAIVWSKEYDRYNEATALSKMQQYLANTTGPAKCQTFEQLRPELCRTCKFKGAIITPLQATIEIGDRVVTVNEGNSEQVYTLPNDYRLTPEKTIVKIVDGIEFPVSDYPVFITAVARHDDPRDPKTYLRFAIHLPHRVTYLEITAASLGGAGKGDSSYQAKFLQAGVAMNSKKMKAFGDYLTDCYQFYQRNNKESKMMPNLGWVDSPVGFAWGDKLLKKDNTHEVVLPANQSMKRIAKDYHCKGDYGKWKEAIAVFNEPGLEHLAFGLLLGFASPLYQHTGLAGVCVNFYSEIPGTGKTTACRAAQSIYGNPKELTMEKTSSVAGIFARLGTIKNLPGFMDEVSDSEGSRVSDLLYSVATGKERDRSDVNGDLKETRAWSLIFMMTSNKSMYEKLEEHTASAAGQQARLIEVNSHPNDIIESKGREINLILSENYGHAALPYLNYLVEAECSGKLKEIIRGALERFEDHFDFKFAGSERFVGAAMVTAWVAGVIAQKELGILGGFDIERIIRATLQVIRDNRQRSLNAVPSIERVIGDYIMENFSAIILMKRFDNPVSPYHCLVPDRPKGRMDVHFQSHKFKDEDSDFAKDGVPNAAIVTIPVKFFKDYCRMNRLPCHSDSE